MSIIEKAIGIILVLLGGYSLISSNYEMVPYAQLLLGVMVLISGFEEFKDKQNNIMATVILILSGFIFYTAIIII